MFPTFFIPGDSSLIVSSYCTTSEDQNVTFASNPELVAGDLELLFISAYTNGTLSYGAVDGNPWHCIMDRYRLINTNAWIGTAGSVLTHRVMARWYDPADAAYTMASTAALMHTTCVSIAIRGANANDPLFTGWFSRHNAGAMGEQGVGPIQFLEAAQAGDLIVAGWKPAATATWNPDPDPDVTEFSCEPANATGIYTPVLGFFASGGNANNLLPYSRTLDLSSWTDTGLTRTVNPAAVWCADFDLKLQPTAANSLHRTETTVTLEQGETYVFAGSFGSTGNAAIWLTVEFPSGARHGICVSGSGNTETDLTDTAYGFNVGDVQASSFDISGDGVGQAGWGMLLPFTATEAGDYKLHLSIHTNTTYEPYTAHAGNTSTNVYLNDLVLQKGPLSAPPMFYPTTTPVSPGDLPYELVPMGYRTNTGVTLSERQNFGFVVRKRGGVRPLCKLASTRFRGYNLQVTDNEITTTYQRAFTNVFASYVKPQPLHSSHAVAAIMNRTKKFYFELYVSSFGSSVALPEYAIGAALNETMHVASNDQNAEVGDTTYQYAYTATGQIYTDGTVEGSAVDAWQAGDYIGVGINLEDWEITYYRNGTLQFTSPITNNEGRYGLWMGMVNFFDESTHDMEARFVYNFKGAFGGRKPSGFSALDFDNEVA